MYNIVLFLTFKKKKNSTFITIILVGNKSISTKISLKKQQIFVKSAEKIANFCQNGRTELQDKFTERSAEPVRSISAERSAEPFWFGRTLFNRNCVIPF